MEKQPIDLQALADDLAPILAKHGFTAGYMVVETRRPDERMAAFCGVTSAETDGSMPTEFLMALAKQTFAIIKTLSIMDLSTGRN